MRFLFSFPKGVYNICAKHTQVNRQVSVGLRLFAFFFRISSTSIKKLACRTN